MKAASTIKPIKPTNPITHAFRWHRFCALVRVDLAERWRTYGGFLLSTLTIQLLIICWALFNSPQPSPMRYAGQMGWYYGFLMAFGAAFAFLLFAPMHKHGASMLALLRPASVFEKWLHAALLLLVLFPLAYTLVYLLVMLPANGIAAAIEATRIAQQSASPVNQARLTAFQLFLPLITRSPDGDNVDSAQVFVAWWYLIMSGFLSFALVRFRRAAAIKTIGLAIIILILSGIALSSGNSGSDVVRQLNWLALLRGDSSDTSVGMHTIIANVLFWLVAPCLTWLSAWLALKEKDLA